MQLALRVEECEDLGQAQRVGRVVENTQPVRTLAAAGISDFRRLLDYVENNAPLGRNVNIDEVGNVAAFLCSDLASGVTGEITYVDCGFNIASMGSPEK